MNLRSSGLALAAGLSVIGAVVVGVAFLRGPGPRAGTASSPMDAPEVVRTGPAKNSRAETVPDIIAASELEQGRVSLYDQAGRLSQVITFDAFDPLEAGRFRVSNPSALLYFPDGRTAEIRADSAQFLQRQQRQEPESGWFRGDVRVRFFDRGEGPGAEAAAPVIDAAPAVALFTDSLDFDTVAGELRMEGPIRVESPAASWSGQAVTILFSPKDRRLLFMRVERSGGLTIRPGSGRNNEARAAQSERQPVVTATASEQRDRSDAREDRYRAEFAGPVRLSSGAGTVEAERLEVWLRTFDGALRDGAIRPLFDDARVAPSAGSDRASIGEAGGGAPAAESALALTWEGAMELRPVGGTPVELAGDDVFARLSSPTRGRVIFRDDKARLEAEGSGIEYGATRRLLALVGAGPRSTVLRLLDRGEALSGRVEADLGAGIARLPGPGVMQAVGAGLNTRARNEEGRIPPRDISWRGGAEIRFAPTADGRITLRDAAFSEGVLGREANVHVSGEAMRVEFGSPAGGGAAPERLLDALARVTIRDGAKADAGAAGFVHADRIDVEFSPVGDPASGRTIPAVATATGGARAEREGSSIRGEVLEARFLPEDSRGVRLDALDARLGVSVRTRQGEDDVEARAEALRATRLSQPGREVIELSGEAAIRRGPLALRAGAVAMDAEHGRLTVVGPGQADFTRAAASGEPGVAYDTVRLSWARSFTFDDAAGRAESAGDVLGVAESGDRLRDLWRGERLIVAFTPRGQTAQDGGVAAAPGAGIGAAAARVGEITLLSAAEEGVGEAQAEIESRRYAADTASESGQRLESLVFVTGPRILADARREIVRVPEPGKLLIEDRRESGATGPADRPSAGARGTTLIGWGGSMTLRRGEGEGVIDGKVRLRHRATGAEEPADMECERLLATFTTDGASLLTAAASEGVFVQMGRRQLTADTATYDARTGLARIAAAPGNVVSLLDEAQGVAQNAREIEWDLARDRIRVLEASPLRTGR